MGTQASYALGVPLVTCPHDSAIQINYETFGFDDGPALLLVNGLGSQLNGWPEEFCQGLVDRGFFVVRFDNRDVGLSSRTDEASTYTLTDMAADALTVLDDLDIAKAHIVGMSMGGMIVQTMAIEHPDRVLTMTSIMSTTGEREFGKPAEEALAALLTPPAVGREAAVAQDIAHRKIWASPEWFDEALVRQYFEESYDRSNDGRADRQYAAVVASGSRAEQLATLTTPTLVIHGDKDTLIDISGGRRTAELVPGAEFLEIEGMGHDIPVQTWQQIISSVTALASRNA